MTDCPTVKRPQTPCFLILAHDVEDLQTAACLRAEHLDGHLAHVETHWRRYVTAGPIRAPGEARIIGSSFLVLADNEADARVLMGGDPYFASGLYGRVEVYAQTLAIGDYLGGKTWESADAVRHLAAGGQG
ncbi:MAG: YciI family protein [Oceanicaulis sp.]